MALNFVARETKGVTILDLSGKIVLGRESQALRERVKQLLEEGKKKILLNLANITFIDSSGVGALVSAYTSTRAQGGDLKLTNLTEKFQETLMVTRLLTVFEVYDNEADAVAKFQ
ncbi:MAG TPA: STAS domain-containing protein [Candidatus Acidoferrales bacterium]|nr:STAS domain-containing protein [Candidatus Acidoferrales bacterium]